MMKHRIYVSTKKLLREEKKEPNDGDDTFTSSMLNKFNLDFSKYYIHIKIFK